MPILLQLTDPHLFGGHGGRLKGVHTGESLAAVLGLAMQHHPAADALLFTGDLSQDESVDSYRNLARLCAPLPMPVYALPGNHDDLAAMAAGLGADEAIHYRASFNLGDWRIILLNSALPGKVGGDLSRLELKRLEVDLHSHADRPVLVCLHHPPLPVGAQWMDAIGLANGDALFAVLDRHPNVAAVLFGHVHQAFDVTRNGVRMLSAPSTCIQFAPRQDEFTLDRLTPGYRWLELGEDGNLTTGIERLVSAPTPQPADHDRIVPEPA